MVNIHLWNQVESITESFQNEKRNLHFLKQVSWSSNCLGHIISLHNCLKSKSVTFLPFEVSGIDPMIIWMDKIWHDYVA